MRVILSCFFLCFAPWLCSLEHAMVGFYAVNSVDKQVLMEKNSEITLSPGSCLKIVTTAAALHILGVEHRFETHLEYDGVIADGVLQGNVYIRGGGDPCLGSGRMDGSLAWESQVEAWVRAIEGLGIKKITGKVIGDASKWEKALAVPSWSWEDLGNYYGAGACALTFHENCYSVFFRPDKKVGGSATLLRTEPPMTLEFHNEVRTGAEGTGDCACIYGSEFSPLQFVRGTIPAKVHEFAIKGAIPDPAATCADLLCKGLESKGVRVERKDLVMGKSVSFHITYSPTVGEIVLETNRKSINLYAEHLLKRMGEVVYQEGSTEAGIKAALQFWKSQGIDLDGFNMVDGSGLSRKNGVTPAQFVHMLLKIKTLPFFSVFMESLPEVQGMARAKSGSMSLIKGYVGYSGDVAFAILVNQCADRVAINEKINQFLSDLK